ncbi:protein ALP1-like, partial [Pyrus x bretschneideri]|uniref:protein ALP1-like n=1 Tax=Pyrus x bretschneideri TaxID=225117 RepID=UPI0020307483
RRFRMERHLFNKIMIAVCNHDSYFVQKKDAFGAMGLLPEQKITAALRMLAYGASADQVDEITRMGQSTILESLMRFCGAIESIYTAEYLRKPTHMDLERLLKKAEMRGFPGMIGSIDYMHWTWKNCPSAWQGAYGDRKGAKSIILEAVASFDTWIWHAFFGVPGAQNDINVLAQSPVFNDVLQGKAPKVTYEVNGRMYDGPYYLADGIYPRWSTFVKTVPRPRSAKEKHFASCQEGCRKDVERCFGILQARWAIVRGAARLFDVESLRSIMMTCIILHNMIVE